MSINAISNPNSLFALLSQGSQSASAMNSTGGSASFALLLAELQARATGTLVGAGADASANFGLDAFVAGLRGSAAASTGLPASGGTSALADPASAFGMMSFINQENVDFKAEYAELDQMRSCLADLQQAGSGLAGIGASADIKTQLQSFVDQYNGWVKRFDADMQSGGILAGTRAAQVSRYELAQSIQNRFNGVADGFNGLADLGVSIDATTGLATLDGTKLDSALANNRQGVADTLNQFGTGFAKSAGLLDSQGNFVANRLDNLGRAIGYLRDNLRSFQAEFGTGAAAKPSAQVAQALAAYNQALMASTNGTAS
jgi:Flagellar hook-associated protein 2 C-terminus